MRREIVHFEIPADDTTKGHEFWARCSGGSSRGFPGAFEYHMARISEQTGGGITDMEPGRRGLRVYVGDANPECAEEIAARAQKDPKLFLSQGSPGASFSRAILTLSEEGARQIPPANPLPRLPSLPIDPGAMARMTSGQVYPSVVETPEAFRVLRVGRQNSGYVEVDAWSVPKVAYQDWLVEQAQRLDKAVESPELKGRLDGLDAGNWLRRAFR